MAKQCGITLFVAIASGHVAPGVSTYFMEQDSKVGASSLSLADVHLDQGSGEGLGAQYAKLPVKNAAAKQQPLRGYEKKFDEWHFQLRQGRSLNMLR